MSSGLIGSREFLMTGIVAAPHSPEVDSLEVDLQIAQQNLEEAKLAAEIQNLQSQVVVLRSEVASLQAKIDTLENDSDSIAGGGIAVLLVGVFCAVWAQNTGRNAWLWFFLGIFLAPIALLVLLLKNSEGRSS